MVYLASLFSSANNLYGDGQTRPMPVGDYAWCTPEEIAQLDWEAMDDDQSTGYIVEVTLSYPKKFHRAHNSYPLAPEHVVLKGDELSPYAKNCYKTLNPLDKLSSYSAQKLTATFNTREKYVVHYMNLRKYLELGMKLVKVHRVLKFQQSTFLRQYIDHCTQKRMSSKTPFQKNLWKFFNNANFGKFIERIRDYINCVLARNDKTYQRCLESPRYKSCKIMNENLVIMFLSPPKVTLDKAYAIGFTILERSKEFMYDQYYNVIKPLLGNAEVLFSDTDSFCIAVTSQRKQNNLEKLNPIMDYSNYPKHHAQFSDCRRNQLGLFKDELCGEKMDEFVGLRSKTYAFTLKNKKMTSKCKGVRKGYKKTIPFASFKKCITSIASVRITQYHIVSKNHNLETSKVDKLCFSSFDDKRWLMDCKIHSVPYGSRLIKKKQCVYCK
jgi:hypothetical protein